MARPSSTISSVTLASLAYATLRYNVCKGVAWSDWPIFILNKALALSSLVLLVGWVVRSRRGTGAPQTGVLAAASRLLFAHAALSLAVLTPVYFPGFFADGRLTWQAGAGVALGVAAAGGVAAVSRSAHARPSARRALGLLAFAAGSHAALFGYSSWLLPFTWPGYLPPITLLSFSAGLVGLAASLGGRPSPPARH